MMAESSVSFQYALVDIRVEKFCIENIDGDAVSIESLPLNFQISFAFDSENEKIKLILIAKVHASADGPVICELAVEFDFSVLGLKSVEQEGERLQLPKPFLVNLTNIGYGTLRGIFHERVSNTRLRGLILPILYPKDLFEAQDSK